MRLLFYLTDLFIDVFGITRPSARARQQAACFIMGLLLLTILVVVAAGLVLHTAMR